MNSSQEKLLYELNRMYGEKRKTEGNTVLPEMSISSVEEVAQEYGYALTPEETEAVTIELNLHINDAYQSKSNEDNYSKVMNEVNKRETEKDTLFPDRVRHDYDEQDIYFISREMAVDLTPEEVIRITTETNIAIDQRSALTQSNHI